MNKVEKMEQALDLAPSLLDLKEGETYKTVLRRLTLYTDFRVVKHIGRKCHTRKENSHADRP